MVRINGAALAALFLMSAALPCAVAGQTMESKASSAAIAFVNRMDAGDFTGAQGMVAASLAPKFTAAAMTPVWTQVTGGARIHDVKVVTVTKASGLDVVDLSLMAGQAPLRLRVAVDADLKVNGFFVLPPAPVAYAPPSYVDVTKFDDIPLKISGGGILMPAMLTLPKGVTRAPVVVLVAGSGPNDMDETVGPNKPFKDIAWGLASRGIAVLRYDKRTRVGAGHLDRITVEEEVLQDALTALDSARENPRVDPMRSFLLGHSLGAMLAPEIAARDSGLAGVLVLAGTPRKLAAVMDDQFTYLKTVPSNAGAASQKSLSDAQAEVERLVRREAKPEELVLGAPASYFYDLDARDAMKFAKSLNIPMLFLQGGRDYQVLPLDLDLWKTGLAGRKNTSFKLYEDLNHLFMTGTGKATPGEYNELGHVKQEVVEDIARFINGSPARHP